MSHSVNPIALDPSISQLAQKEAPLTPLSDWPALGLSEGDLRRLPVYSIREICLSKTTIEEAMPWVKAGGLSQADQNLEYERGEATGLGPPRNLRVCESSYQLLAQRFQLADPERLCDLLLAACEGAQRLSAAHGPSRSLDSFLRDFFSDRAREASEALKLFQPLKRLDLGPEFDDPRVTWLHIPQPAFLAAMSPQTRHLDQLERKNGFAELLIDALKTEEELGRFCAIQASLGPLSPDHPLRRALEMIKAREAWDPNLANLCAFPGQNWPYSASGLPFSGLDNMRALAPEWPMGGFDLKNAWACVTRARRHDPEGPDALAYLQAAGSAALRQSMQTHLSFHGLLSLRFAPLFSAAQALDRPRLEGLMDLIDQEGPSGWTAWTEGPIPVIDLPSSTQPKTVDWLFGLASLKIEPALILRAAQSIPGYSPSQSRPIARWLRERSERGATPQDREQAKAIFDIAFPLFEALELAELSRKASSCAAQRRSEKNPDAPAPPPVRALRV